MKWGLCLTRILRCDSATARRTMRFYHKNNSSPISNEEFTHRYEQILLGKKHPKNLAVAFSGGPDSTCLLFLLDRMLKLQHRNDGIRTKLLAITIDHGLQSHSSEVTKHCSAIAKALGIEHITHQIPWGTLPFPPFPARNAPFEKIARESRFHLLFDTMRRQGISHIAFGHHADDQVETALLRLAKGSSEIGIAAMRSLRRWGMGFGEGDSALGWAGYPGMNTWIVRPLLSFSKDRIYSTACAHGLTYVQDPTNFQPTLTERNFIRHNLHEMGKFDKSQEYPLYKDIQHLLNVAEPHTVIMESMTRRGTQEEKLTLASRLRSAVEAVSHHVSCLDAVATNALTACSMPSSPSTILMSSEALESVTDCAVRIAMVRRILRFVSPHPWGSMRAEAGGHKSSLRRIVDRLWNIGTNADIDLAELQNHGQPFIAGASVMWSPVTILSCGMYRRRAPMKNGERSGWLVHRQPPIRQGQVMENVDHFRPTKDPLHIDITEVLQSALRTNEDAEILYDCRFVIRIKASLLCQETIYAVDDHGIAGQIKASNARIFIIPHSNLFLPRIVLRMPHPSISTDTRWKEREGLGRIWDDFEIAKLRISGQLEYRGENNGTLQIWGARPDEEVRQIGTLQRAPPRIASG